MSQGSLRRSSSAAPGRHSAEAFALFDVVRVRQAVPEHHLAGGEEGTIVEILAQPVPAYLVDFSGGSADPADQALPVVALTADQLTPVWPRRPTTPSGIGPVEPCRETAPARGRGRRSE